MPRFVQLHILTNYPPANLNRDDTGRPKTALMGDALRLRVSSQSLKRAWRTSDQFAGALAGNLGTRTKAMGRKLYADLKALDVQDKQAREWAKLIAKQFGKPKSEKKTENDEDLEIEQLAHFSPDEIEKIDALVKKCAQSKSEPTGDDLKLLVKPRRGVDIAMFGRMLANSPEFNIEAAVQVAHAVTVNKAAVEDDYFSAVDDLNRDDKGAGHIGERGFGAGLFYLYLCIDRDLLTKNLGGDESLTGKSLAALLNAVTKVSPTGMQNSHASRAYASFVLAERGDQQPRSLVQAFLKPIRSIDDDGDGDDSGGGMLDRAVKAMERRCENFDKVYGACADGRYRVNVETGEGSLTELIAFAQG